MHILIVGGGGYIGSHMLLSLAEQGHRLSTPDNFSSAPSPALWLASARHKVGAPHELRQHCEQATVAPVLPARFNAALA